MVSITFDDIEEHIQKNDLKEWIHQTMAEDKRRQMEEAYGNMEFNNRAK